MTYVINSLGGDDMPRKDGTGPRGLGSMTGKGFGVCTGAKGLKNGPGIGLGMGFSHKRNFRKGMGRCLLLNEGGFMTEKDVLQRQKEFLEERLEALDKMMKNL